MIKSSIITLWLLSAASVVQTSEAGDAQDEDEGPKLSDQGSTEGDWLNLGDLDAAGEEVLYKGNESKKEDKNMS